jgi:hypothetical protein
MPFMRITKYIEIFILVLICGCNGSKKKEFPSIGDSLPDSAIFNNQIFYKPPELDSAFIYKFNYNGISFFLIVNNEYIIENILTSDSNFITPEGIRIGDNAVKADQSGKLVLNSNNYCIYEMPSKWTIVFEVIDTLNRATMNINKNLGKMKAVTIRK